MASGRGADLGPLCAAWSPCPERSLALSAAVADLLDSPKGPDAGGAHELPASVEKLEHVHPPTCALTVLRGGCVLLGLLLGLHVSLMAVVF